MRGNGNFGDWIAEWTGAVALGGACGFAAFSLAPLAAAPAALVATLAARAVLRRVGEPVGHRLEFEPTELEVPAEAEPLLLTDRLEVPGEDSRVLRLFAPDTIDVPGEMVERIEHWLADARRRHVPTGDRAAGHGPASSPASAALHSAISDIRRSLR